MDAMFMSTLRDTLLSLTGFVECLEIVLKALSNYLFQLPMSWLNAEAIENIEFIRVTSAVFQLPMSWLKEVP